MNIAIMGIGGVGGYFGGKLAKYCENKKDMKTVFIARGKHLEEILKNGLKVIADESTFVARPYKASSDPESCGLFDLIIFCVKSYDLEESAKLFKNCVNKNTVAITILNGVNNSQRLKAVLPDTRILDGCVYIGASIEKAGVVRQSGGSCQFYFGDESTSKEYLEIEQLLIDAGIKAEYRKDIKKVIWEKYMFVSPLASATSYCKKTFGEIMEDEQSKSILIGLLKEVENVSKYQKIFLPDDICKKSIDKVSLFPYETKSSLQMDFERKKKTELDIFTGYIINCAKEYGLSVPYHEKVYKVLSSI
ncbi:MAG: 2-dehydropantoate 2-reductase [Proteobacteria bacterium]|nr:2-dehydropantoate 2-reductase [Pseudomonadota bacterium]